MAIGELGLTMLSVLSVIFPIFFIILLGFASVKSNLVAFTAVGAMGRYVLYLALPAVIIKTILALDIERILHLQYLSAYAIASLVLIIFATLFLWRIKRLAKIDSALMVTGIVVPNSAFIGYPILMQLMDNPPVNAFAMALMVENIFIMPLCFILLDYCYLDKPMCLRSQLKGIAKRAMTNPLLVAIVLGVMGNLVSLQLPMPIMTGLTLLASSAVAVALFVIGGSLANIVVREVNGLQLLLTGIGKLLLHPLLTGLLIYWFIPLPAELAMALIIITAVPMMSVYTIVGGLYQKAEFCATAQLVTTACSVLTIPLVIYLASMVWPLN